MRDAIDIQASLIVEVERLRLVNKRLNRRAQSAEAAADAKAEDWNKRAAGSQLRNHYYARANAAEKRAEEAEQNAERLREVIVDKQRKLADVKCRSEAENQRLQDEIERLKANWREAESRVDQLQHEIARLAETGAT